MTDIKNFQHRQNTKISLKPLAVKSLSLNNNLILAPLAGFTSSPMRLLTKELGRPGLVVTEMVSENTLHYQQKELKEITAFDPAERPVSMQIFGRNPAFIAEGARFLESLGAEIVDINMGCSVKKVLKAKSGAYLLKDTDAAVAVTEAAASAVKIPVSCKLRTGFSKGEINAPELAKRLEGAGAAMIAIHGRRACESWNAPVDFDSIRRVKEAVSIPVIGNGNIRDAAGAKEMFEKTGCDGIMVGRAALGNPWVFEEIRAGLAGESFTDPSAQARRDALLRHYELAEKLFGPTRAPAIMRKVACLYVKGMKGARTFREKLNRVSTGGELRDAAGQYFEGK